MMTLVQRIVHCCIALDNAASTLHCLHVSKFTLFPHDISILAAQEANEGYDVYVNEPEPLNEGEEKHIISAFVADESGIINRVAGVFARRGVSFIAWLACTCTMRAGCQRRS